MLNGVAFFRQLLFGSGHSAAAEVADFQTLNNFPLAIAAAAWERVNQAFSNPVGAIRVNTHGNPIVTLCTERPIAHVVNGGVGS